MVQNTQIWTWKFQITLTLLSISTWSSAATDEVNDVTDTSNFSVTEAYDGVKYKPGDLVFHEEFDTFDLELWKHEITAGGGGNGEFQYYRNNRSNSYVKDGHLYIKPSLTIDTFGEEFLTKGTLDLNGNTPNSVCTTNFNFGCRKVGSEKYIINPIASAKITTYPSFAFKYGRLVVRAKLPKGDWLWPAIWLLPKSERYGPWPASGEIDLMESRGNTNLSSLLGMDIGVNQFGSTVHFGPDWRHDSYTHTHFVKNAETNLDFHERFHDYVMHWTPDYMEFSLDGNVLGTVKTSEGGFWSLGGFPSSFENPWRNSKNPKMAPFDQKFFIVINLAIGGTNGYFNDFLSINHPPKPWINMSPTAMKEFWSAKNDWYPTWSNSSEFIIDSVKVYAV